MSPFTLGIVGVLVFLGALVMTAIRGGDHDGDQLPTAEELVGECLDLSPTCTFG